jgi:uncharacterized membrane protein YbhN (UPF0104 family)
MSQPETPEPKYPPPTGGGAGSVALFVIGVLILLPSGLCSAVFGFGAIFELFNDPRALASGFLDALPVVAITVVFLVIGILMVRASLRAKKNR